MTNTHKEFAVQWSSPSADGKKCWWTIGEWRRDKQTALDDWDRFANRNEFEKDFDYGHRLVSRDVSEITVDEEFV